MLTWVEQDQWHSVSECRLYSVCRVMLPDPDAIDPARPDVTPLRSYWEAWAIGARSRASECLASRLPLERDAKDECEAHAAMTHRAVVP